MKIRTLSTLAVMTFGFALLTFTGSVQAQTAGSCQGQFPTQYPPGTTILQLNKSSVVGGSQIVVKGCGAPNGTVFFTIDGQSIGSTTTDSTGFYSTTLPVPCNLSIANHVLKATGAANNSATVTITGNLATCPGGATGSEVLGNNANGNGNGANGTTATGGSLVRTGNSSTMPLSAAGIGLVAIGAVAVVAARKRRTADSISE